jgi:hypothetical protein
VQQGAFPHAAFGTRTIADIRGAAFGLLRRKWPGKSLDDLEDAVSEGMVDLIELWPFMPSTQRLLAENDPEKAFTFAVRYVFGQCLTAFEKERERNIANPVSAMVDSAEEAQRTIGTVWAGGLRERDEPSDEEREERITERLLAGQNALMERVRELLAERECASKRVARSNRAVTTARRSPS